MADLTKCRGCGHLLVDSDEREVAVQYGQLVTAESGLPTWLSPAPTKNTWGRMHERCFLLAIGDPRGVALTAAAHVS